jgi:hypothetical protein
MDGDYVLGQTGLFGVAPEPTNAPACRPQGSAFIPMPGNLIPRGVVVIVLLKLEVAVLEFDDAVVFLFSRVHSRGAGGKCLSINTLKTIREAKNAHVAATKIARSEELMVCLFLGCRSAAVGSQVADDFVDDLSQD